MKKTICMILALVMLMGLCACGKKPAEPEAAEWTRQGYFADENGNVLSITWMDDIDEPGWYLGCMLGEDLIEDSWGGTIKQEKNTLHGVVTSSGSRENLTVTVSEEGEDGVLLAVEGGETYHFTPMDLPEATILVSVNTEGWGNIAYAEGETAPEIDRERPYQSAQINLAEPATYTFVAWPNEGVTFLKWTRNGEDFSTEAQITVLLDESAEYVAVFDWGQTELANPWRDVSEEEAKELCIKSFKAPEGAENVCWSVMDAAADESGVPGALVQVNFDWNGLNFTAREQITGEEEADISGMYYDWSDQRQAPLKNWADGAITAQLYRFTGEGEYADLCTWYDSEAGVSYALNVTADDLDGFDILAVAEAMCG